MKIYLISIDPEMVQSWTTEILRKEKELGSAGANIELYEGSFYQFATKYNPYVDGWVSPANSYGLMDGGYDKGLTDYFGKEIQYKVQEAINNDWCGEQPVGTSLSVWMKDGWLIHTPTMRIPSIIKDSDIVYHCTRSCIIEAYKRGCNSILIPAFGAGTGRVPCEEVAKKMIAAIIQLTDNNKSTTWKYARWEHPLNH